jgi:hypothetical protein
MLLVVDFIDLWLFVLLPLFYRLHEGATLDA